MFKFSRPSVALLLLALISQASARSHPPTTNRSSMPRVNRSLLREQIWVNWLVPEGYMWRFEGGPQSPGEIRALVLELLGPEGSDAFCRSTVRTTHAGGHHAPASGRLQRHSSSSAFSLFESDDAEGFSCWTG